MASEEIKSVKWTCDGCGTTRLVPDGGAPPDGLHIPLAEMHRAGQVTVRTPGPLWAHSWNCVRKSLENALQGVLGTEAEPAEEATGA